MSFTQVSRSRSEASSPSLDEESTHVFENLAKKLHRLESKLGKEVLANYIHKAAQVADVAGYC